MSLAFDLAADPALPRAATARGRRFGGGALGLGLAASLALHAGLLAPLLRQPLAPAPLLAAGSAGEDMVTLEALQASFVELAPELPRPVLPRLELPRLEAPQLALPLTAPVIDIPELVLPDPVVLPPEPPKFDLPEPRPAPPQPTAEPPKPKRAEPKPKPPKPKTEKPKTSPAPAPAPAPARSEARAASRAAGAGGGAEAGTGGTARASAPSAGTAKNLLAQWGATIRARIERRKSYPAAAGRASGSVSLSLTVGASGHLLGASVSRSSGNAALDAAALGAVRKAGPFPAAPQGLGKASYSFSLALKFSR